MEAAERFFDGAFDNVKDDDGDVEMGSSTASAGGAKAAPAAKSSVVRRALSLLDAGSRCSI